MFQSVLINTYARRVKTKKYPRIFMRTTRYWGFNYLIDQAALPQHFGPSSRISKSLDFPLLEFPLILSQQA